jgi:trk system potassium uptake protein TrkA
MAIKEEKQQGNFLIIGLGTFGTHLAEAMLRQEMSLVLVDTQESHLVAFKDNPSCILRVGDATNESLLEDILEESLIEYAVVCIGENLTASILTSLILKNHNVLHIYARANTPQHAEILRRIGVTEIIQPELETAQKWARNLINRGELIVSYQELSDEYVVVEMAATTPLIYTSLEEQDLRRRFHLNVVGIRSRRETLDEKFQAQFNEFLRIPPDPNYVFQEGDRIIVAGRDADIQRFKDYLLGKDA